MAKRDIRPCPTGVPITGHRMAYRDHRGRLKTIKLTDDSDPPGRNVDEWGAPHCDFSPWLTASALDAFDPDAREAGEFLLEIAKAAAVNKERERRKSSRGGTI